MRTRPGTIERPNWWERFLMRFGFAPPAWHCCGSSYCRGCKPKRRTVFHKAATDTFYMRCGCGNVTWKWAETPPEAWETRPRGDA